MPPVPETQPPAFRILASSPGTVSASFTAPQTLDVDLTGAGLPTIFPGAGFAVNPPTSGAATVSTAGFLGTFWINQTQSDLDARTGLSLGTSGALTGTTTVTLSGDFATITNAYLVPNNAGPPTANMSSACSTTQPSNAIGGATTINAGRNLITFPGLPTPANNAATINSPVFAVCLVTNGNQVIQAPSAILISASVAITGAPANSPAVGLTGPGIGTAGPNTSFGLINYPGTVFFAQNVFGINNGSPTFFRMVNTSNTSAPVWAVLTKDVPNTSPLTAGTGREVATFQQGRRRQRHRRSQGRRSGRTRPTTCNISFVAGLHSVAGAARHGLDQHSGR